MSLCVNEIPRGLLKQKESTCLLLPPNYRQLMRTTASRGEKKLFVLSLTARPRGDLRPRWVRREQKAWSKHFEQP